MELTVGSGETALFAKVTRLGSDIVVQAYGGSKPHVGAVAVGIPTPSLKNPAILSSSVSIFTVTGHKDDYLAKELSQHLASALCSVVVTVAGFHIDGASKEQIVQVLDNCKQLVELIVSSPM